ncbi:MAG: carboxypeptidase regulatory-like domain-containing protein [Candidatus Solibacter usitatus]|nr:carboxypeptidase regulatory-like domain-containing protein [Candidatus Solibacter usitatus]
MTRRLLLALALSAAALGAFQWTNQKKDKARDPHVRNVTGVVNLPDGSLAVGAVVQLKNRKSLQVRSFITQTNGKYQFQNLSTGVDYELKADFNEFSSPVRALTIFDTRLDAIVNLKLEPGKAGQKPAPPAEEKKP